MDRRSTSAEYTHYGGDVTAQVNSSHGVRLSGGSTGGIVEAVGDDTNVTLTLRAQGTGSLILGSSGQPVQLGGSTSPFAGIVYFSDAAAVTPNFNTTNAMTMETTHAIAGLTTGAIVMASMRSDTSSTDAQLVSAFASNSTAGEVHCRFIKVSTLTFAGSTATIRFAVLRF